MHINEFPLLFATYYREDCLLIKDLPEMREKRWKNVNESQEIYSKLID